MSGSAAMYWNHVDRAVSEGGLCRAIEKHVARINTNVDGAIRSNAMDLAVRIQDQCEQSISKRQARCILKVQSMSTVRACN